MFQFLIGNVLALVAEMREDWSWETFQFLIGNVLATLSTLINMDDMLLFQFLIGNVLAGYELVKVVNEGGVSIPYRQCLGLFNQLHQL